MADLFDLSGKVAVVCNPGSPDYRGGHGLRGPD